MHLQMSRPSRVERTTTSCGECRRRKQRCNQGRPCSNCARRFPPPPCEYKTTRPLPNPRNAHIHQPPALFPEEPGLPGLYDPFLGPKHIPPLPSPWAGSPLPESGDVMRWSGLDMATQFPPTEPTPTPPPPPPNPWELSLAFPVATGQPGFRYVSPCGDGFASQPDEVHSTLQMMQGAQGMADPFLVPNWNPDRVHEDVASWFTLPELPQPLRNMWPVGNSPMQELLGLPAPPTQQDADLLKLFVRTLAPFAAALDGNAESSHAYLKYYVPFMLQSPLLTQTAMHAAACFLHETDHMEKVTALAYKTQAVGLLNEHIWSGAGLGDEVIAALVQLILNEWYWGDGTDLGAHLRGLREMIRLRGGLKSLGLHGLIAKMAVTADISISLAHSIQPSLPLERFDTGSRVPLRLTLNTPLVPSLPRFSACAEALHLDPATAAVLDDMRFLISAVLALPARASEKELNKIRTTSAWIHNRISALPDYHSPDGPQPGARPCGAEEGDGPDEGGRYRMARTPSIVVTDQDGGMPGGGEGGYAGRRGSWHSWSPQGSPTLLPAVHQRAASEQLQASSLPNQATTFPPSFQHNQHDQPEHQPQDRSPHHPQQPPDPLYQSVRLAALLYARAITTRQPFHAAAATPAGTADLQRLWAAVWHVPLATWKQVLGVFHWALLPLAPAAGHGHGPVSAGRRHGRFVKSMLVNGGLQMATDNWEVAGEGMERAVALAGWLAGGQQQQQQRGG